jgi:radical SAM-linked protein
MAPEPSSAPPGPGQAQPAGDPACRATGAGRAVAKVRLRFCKEGNLRLLSHHDLLRTFERMLRRAGVPSHRTQGFNPRPRLVFALSLPLGVVGRAEVADLELDEAIPAEILHQRLASQTPPGLAILAVRPVGLKAGLQVRGLSYGVAVPPERVPGVIRASAEVLAAGECWVERTRPPRRRLDLRPFLRDLRLLDEASGGRQPPDECANQRADAPRSPSPFLEMDLWLSPSGTARPEEVLGLLGLGDLVDAGALLERTRLDLKEEPPPAGSA